MVHLHQSSHYLTHIDLYPCAKYFPTIWRSFYHLYIHCHHYTLPMILQDSIALDDDLLANSARSLETLVTVGMQLGVSIKKCAELQLPDINNCVLGAWICEISVHLVGITVSTTILNLYVTTYFIRRWHITHCSILISVHELDPIPCCRLDRLLFNSVHNWLLIKSQMTATHED